jgi:Immunity protein 50
MTQMRQSSWIDFLRPDDRLIEFYGTLPDLADITLQSIHFNHLGPTIYVRVDMPGAPAGLPQELLQVGCDKIQLTLEFLAVEDFILTGFAFPSQARMTALEAPEVRAIFHVEAEGLSLDFSAHRWLRVGHLSAYRSSVKAIDDPDVRRHYFLGKVDSRLYREIPDPWIETFYGRL